MKKIAFLGLGVMGYPMAGHLLKSDYQVCAYNRNPKVTHRWIQEHATHPNALTSDTIAGACIDADIVMTCVGNDDDVRQLYTCSNGVLESMKSGSIVIDHTTTSAHLAREMQTKAIEKQVRFLDAPISGGEVGAQKGLLTIMVGGAHDAYEIAQPVLQHYAKKVAYMGDSGNGQLTKMVNQVCIAGVLQGLSEGMHFAKKAKLDVESVVDVISQGAAQSWQMDNRAITMARDEFDFGFAVDWMKKDLNYCLQQAESMGVSLPLTAQVNQFYTTVKALGGGRWDTSSLIKALDRTHTSDQKD